MNNSNQNYRLLQGDCLDVLKRFSSNRVGLVVTDPPYLVQYRSRDGRTISNDHNSGSWLAPSFQEIYRILKPDSFCISFYGWNQVERFMLAWKKAGFRPVGHLVWSKQYHSSVRYLKRRHEQAYLLAKGNPAQPQEPMDDVLAWQYSGNRFHPTQKTEAILRPLITAFSKPGEIVLDPFAGSGSTVLAALQVGRKGVGIELDPKYFTLAQTRLKADKGA